MNIFGEKENLPPQETFEEVLDQLGITPASNTYYLLPTDREDFEDPTHFDRFVLTNSIYSQPGPSCDSVPWDSPNENESNSNNDGLRLDEAELEALCQGIDWNEIFSEEDVD